MRTVEADIGHSGELHKLYQEYSKDLGKTAPRPDFWLMKFNDPTFFLLMAKHGKKSVGFIMGHTCPYFDVPTVNLDAVFIRRGFRKLKFTRALLNDAKSFLKHLKIKTIMYTRDKGKVRSFNG